MSGTAPLSRVTRTYTPGYMNAINLVNVKYPQMHPPHIIAAGSVLLHDIIDGRTSWPDYLDAEATSAQIRAMGKAAVKGHRAFGIRMEYKPNKPSPAPGTPRTYFNNTALLGVLSHTRQLMADAFDEYARQLIPSLGSRYSINNESSLELFSGRHTEEVQALSVLLDAGATALRDTDAKNQGKILREGFRGLDRTSASYFGDRAELIRTTRVVLGTLVGTAMLESATELPVLDGHNAAVCTLIDDSWGTSFRALTTGRAPVTTQAA